MRVTHTSDESGYVSIGEAALELGVSRDTLRRWDQNGLVKAKRTPTGHRRYSREQLKRVLAEQGGDESEQAS